MSDRAALATDLDEVLDAAADDLRAFAGARVFVTGGTGFIGTWLLWSIDHANRRLGLGIRADVLTRDPAAFAAAVPELAVATGFRFVKGDVSAPFPTTDIYDGIVHAATPASARLLAEQPNLMLEIILAGGRETSALIERCGAIPVLFTSSGAVYGPQPPTLEALDETYIGAPDCTDPSAAYQEGKRVGELQCAIAAKCFGARAAIARLFAFVGPYLALDRHFAIGNFVGDALAGRPIRVNDSAPYRSYLYASDMTAWLWAVFARGRSARPYNVGSDEPVDIGTLARRVAGSVEPAVPVQVLREPAPGAPRSRYVPATVRIERELGVRRRVQLDEAIRRTVRWHVARARR